MSTKTLIEKAIFKKNMKQDCGRWRRWLKNNKVTLTDIYTAFSSAYPGVISYDGLYKGINQGAFSFENYLRVKKFFEEVEKTIIESKKSAS